MWILITHYDRGNSKIDKFTTKEDAWQYLHVVMYQNEDCINAQIFRQDA
jgi:hypothetical protein